MFIKALHTIQRDPKATPPVIPAATVFDREATDLGGDELDYILSPRVGAARPATVEEVRAAGFKVVGDDAAEREAAEKAAAEAAEKEAAEKAAAEAAEREAAEKAAAEAAEREAAEKASKKSNKKGDKSEDESLV